MPLLVIAAIDLALTVPILVYLAALDMPVVHALVAAAAALTAVALCYLDQSRAREAGASARTIAAQDAQYMGLIWAWGGLIIALTYTLVLDWKEWWQFTIAFGVAAVLAGVSAYRIRASADQGPDAPVLKQSAWLARVQLVGMSLVMLGLFIDGKMDRIGLTMFGPRDWSNDWAGNNAFFFGGLALALLSWLSLRAQAKHRSDSGAAADGAAG